MRLLCPGCGSAKSYYRFISREIVESYKSNGDHFLLDDKETVLSKVVDKCFMCGYERKINNVQNSSSE